MQAVFGPGCAAGNVGVVALLKSARSTRVTVLTPPLRECRSSPPSTPPTICLNAPMTAMALMSSDGGEGPACRASAAIKDLNMAKVRTTFDTMGFSDFVPDIGDLLVARLETRGGIVVGVNTPEMGAGSVPSTMYSDHPWDTQLNAAVPPAARRRPRQGSLAQPRFRPWRRPSARQPAIAVLSACDPARTRAILRTGRIATEGVQGPMRDPFKLRAVPDALSGFRQRSRSHPRPTEGTFEDAVVAAEPRIRIGFHRISTAWRRPMR